MAMLTHREVFPSSVVDVDGGLHLEPGEHGVHVRRLPAWTRPQVSDPVYDFVLGMTSGVRLVTETDADELELELAITGIDPGTVPPATVVVELLVDGGRSRRATIPPERQSLVDGSGRRTQSRPPATVRFRGLGGVRRRLEVWLPHTAAVELVALSADAPLHAPTARDDYRWVHHGSSISQGGEAHSPTRTWPVVAARTAGVHVRNLGFSGNAVGDPFVARTIRDLPADGISLEIGINVVNGDLMRRRMFEPVLHGFLDTIRDGHPVAPIVLVTPLPCPSLERMPGPTMMDARGRAATAGDPRELDRGGMSLDVVRAALAAVVAARADAHLHVLDGRLLLPDAEVGDLPDGLHPNDAAYGRMGRRFARAAFGRGGPFATAG